MRPLQFFILILSLLGTMLRGSAEEPGRLERDFKDPPVTLKSIPLWHMNGELTTKEIVSQLESSRNVSGFGGVAVLPVRHTKPEYLTNDYFARYGDILETSKRLGMSVVFYDDIGFPSGSAGGRMKEQFPKDVSYRLEKKEWDVEGPCDWTQPIPEGTFMGGVALNLDSWQRLDLIDAASDGRISWQVPAGEWKLMIFTCVNAGDRVDYLNPDSVDRFLSLTYDQYYKRFPNHFGSTITMSFFDDISIRRWGGTEWTPRFNERFEKRYGYNPVTLYPALWHDIGPDTASARIALHDFRADLLAEGYPRQVNEWCSAHRIRSTGHAAGQYHPQPSFLTGDQIKFYRHCDIPMIDSIHYYGHGRPGFKLTSSASYSYDRPLTAVEIYGNYKAFDKQTLYRSGMELFARGANFFLPHGMWYDSETVRIPPLISHFSDEIGPELGPYNDWSARSSLLLRGGRHVSDIGVLYPVATMQAYAQFGKEEQKHPGLRKPETTDFNRLSDLLTGDIRRDFTFLHPHILDEKCRVDGATLHLENKINFEQYSVLIIPAVNVIHWSNLEKIRKFYEAGGVVIGTTELPTQSAESGHDDDVRETIAAIFSTASANEHGYAKRTNEAGGTSYFVPSLDKHGSALAAALQDAMPVADVRFGQDAPQLEHLPQSGSQPPANKKHTGMLSYIHKIKDDHNLYYFANSTDGPIELDVVLRGQLSLQSWNPHDGHITDVDHATVIDHGVACTKVRLKMKPVQSVFFVEKR
ncbi:glycosyl hydrolase [Novipirellula artificiosorum]|uniref:Beta-galactosidase trimerization domain protein n=1 Tax=Novipirellula artificiosorum TaxID=2528016 RepID=A0A5C6DTL3_9BACT|nr:glycosyl hydrolase [Novipirellula artificiosorum]TWU38366.1 hypothetical protein Poly41_28420 [Novipirellula artificiosorum]